MSVNFLTVRIDDKKCKRCYTCIDQCPSGALTLEGIIFCHNAYECMYCESCELSCPKQAITIMGM